MLEDLHFTPRLLLADENITFLTMLSEALRIRFQQLEITTCTSAKQVLEQITQSSYDAVVCSTNLSDIEGLELLKQIQQQQPSLPILLIASHDNSLLITKIIRLGAYDLIYKPIDWAKFEVSLSSALSMRIIEKHWYELVKHENLFEQSNLLAELKVLVVDDDLDCLDFQGMTLMSWGANVKMVRSVRSALEIVQEFQPDLIVCDIRMPYEDGYGLIRKLRRSTPQAHKLPAIAVTAYADEEHRQQALQTGFQLQLEKPFEPAILVLSVATLTGRVGWLHKKSNISGFFTNLNFSHL